jgi:hypothetical protein
VYPPTQITPKTFYNNKIEFWQEFKMLYISQRIQNDVLLNKPKNNEYDYQ